MRMPPARSLLTRVLLLGMLLIVAGGDLGAPLAHAASTRSYSSTTYGYAFQYPASWTILRASTAYDSGVASPDGATTFKVQVIGGTLGQPALRSLATRLLESVLGKTSLAGLQVATTTPAPAGGLAVQAETRAQVGSQHQFVVVRLTTFNGYIFL